MNINREIIIYIVIIMVGIIAAQHMNVVVSGSMEPVFHRGDIVIIQKSNFLGIQEFDPAQLNVGEIVIYNATWFPEPVIHRIIDVRTDGEGRKFYVTQGDNNPTPDQGPVYPEQVKSRVITVGNQPIFLPRIGYITLWIRGL
ncbi:signal peptidase I [Methanobacterium alkalithermotolerans]|uniref:Signal peptidase I n=1 Tax=Methanobacterium alkalithermotolerans TaxID=2731220 RepID=A0A8T8KDH4_9EURY|nr:signal peptidase I [Methanobacterium alkalithermotolerans]QUH23421.1 signal peptidase I [Methanobacterium alkalithermotolerans]RJS49945.1 MAG: signal peptidase I [Methanobacterium sp.]